MHSAQAIVCSYALAAPPSELNGPGYSRMSLSGRNQTASVTLHEDVAAKNYMAAPVGFSTESAAVIDASASVVARAIEWVLGSLPEVTGYSVWLGVYNAAWGSSYVVPTIWYDGALWHLNLGSVTLSDLASAPERIGLYFDTSTGNIGALLDGVDQGTIDTYTPGEIAIGIGTNVDANLTDGQEGLIVTHSLVSAASEITGTAYPLGTLDLCGHDVYVVPPS